MDDIYSRVEVSDNISLLWSLALRSDDNVASDLRCLAIAVDVYNNSKGKSGTCVSAQVIDSIRRMTMLYYWMTFTPDKRVQDKGVTEHVHLSKLFTSSGPHLMENVTEEL